mmetsp:Transcript_22831/g.46956  ORF Transcript_22831/g.46956 Transcript_22831/m.46956 type:complete len:220 (-) Transcript_22831:498-1157(-)
MLKAVPNKNAGFIILFTSIFILFYFMRSLSMSFYFVVKTSNRFNGFYLCFWFLSFFSFIWIGGQFPVDNFLSYARILTLYYYLLIFWFRGLVVPFVLFSHYILFYSVSGSFWLSYLLVSFSLSHYTPFFPWVYIVCSLLTLHYILFLIFGLLSFINYKKEANHYIYSVPFWLFPTALRGIKRNKRPIPTGERIQRARIPFPFVFHLTLHLSSFSLIHQP